MNHLHRCKRPGLHSIQQASPVHLQAQGACVGPAIPVITCHFFAGQGREQPGASRRASSEQQGQDAPSSPATMAAAEPVDADLPKVHCHRPCHARSGGWPPYLFCSPAACGWHRLLSSPTAPLAHRPAALAPAPTGAGEAHCQGQAGGGGRGARRRRHARSPGQQGCTAGLLRVGQGVHPLHHRHCQRRVQGTAPPFCCLLQPPWPPFTFPIPHSCL